MISIWISQRIRFVYIIIFIYHKACVTGLHMTNIKVPEVADIRDSASLSCTYNMGKHKLNSVKWYKNDMEFFRYSPMTIPPIMTFPVVGVHLPVALDYIYNCNRVTCSITMDRLNSKSSGSYRCEVSGDAPEFKLISDTANMTIAALPQMDPIISGLAQNYLDGDVVIANCTSDMSNPAATLMWYINGERAPLIYLQPQQETTADLNGFILRYRSLEIRFHADKSYYINTRGVIKLRCIAKIEQIPGATRESSAIMYITSMNELTNQKLVNWISKGNIPHSREAIIKNLLIICLFKFILFKIIFKFDAS